MEQFQKRLKEAENAAYGQRNAERGSGAERWRRGGAQTSGRSFGRGRESFPPPGSEYADRGLGRGDRRGARRDWQVDRGQDSQDHRRGDRLRDGRTEEAERGTQGGPWERAREGGGAAKFLKPTASEDDTWTGWARKNDAAPSSSSSGFLRPSDEGGEAKQSRTPAWKKPSFREPEPVPEKSPVTSAGPEDAPHPDPKHSRGGDASPQRQPIREADSALPANRSHRPMASSPRRSTAPAQTSESEEEEEVQILSDEEMNKLGAKLVKAELMGNTALVDKLKAQLDSARKAKESAAQNGPALIPKSKDCANSWIIVIANEPLELVIPPMTMFRGRAEEDQEVVLFRTDQAGRAWPVNAPSQPAEPKGGRRKKKAVRATPGTFLSDVSPNTFCV
ncbi:hypothetical protein SKAU_G00080870 [Synaphobranchus kaupii]|uniref:Uncharacterized protein n=1 Tax=Synaphobranchus kaupii TaxID=118154 RepID=A0A9Q1J567_SYNKA|nr:hypothetical protein SKAU_G00080870 [Synaphobranchus kaupii]